jgi:hypothetical protein
LLFFEVQTLLLCREQTTLDIDKLNEVFRIKLRAFLPHLFAEEQHETELEVVEKTIDPPTREFENLWSVKEVVYNSLPIV